ncbi:MAG: 4'-phosphopantetheinyl transferase superfamily protein [Clostridia bacterium]|nr:4'-phosphopantetheinyl transferase superfamily protein [Clostridia bacterium]
MSDPHAAPTLLLAARVDALRDPAVFEAMYAAASDDRRRKTDRLLREADRRRCLGAEALLRLALRRTGINVPLDYTYNENGKPALAHAPQVGFSLSHSGDFVLCAVAQGAVGCDIQAMQNVRLALAKRFFAAEEYAAIAAQPTESAQADLFFRCWTLKEAALKADGSGFRTPLKSARVRLGKDGDAAVTVGGQVYHGREFGEIDGYRCAVCLPRDVGDVRLQQVSLI